MNNTNCRMMISDLDGTLVPYGSDELSDRTKAQVGALSKTDVLFTVATGRSWRQAKPVVSELKIIAPVIVQTGALIIDPLSELVLHAQLLQPQLHQMLHQLSESMPVGHLVLGDDGVFYGTQISLHSSKWLAEIGEKCTISERSYATSKIVKHLFMGAESELKQIIDWLQLQIKPLPNFILWPPDLFNEDWLLEVLDSKASKGQAVQWLTDKLGVKSEEVIAFGDGYNDLDMLRWAGTGVAVRTAPADLRRVADRLVAGPEENGVADFIEEWLQTEKAAG